VTAPRRAARRLTQALGWRVSAAVRVLPDFLVIGAQKAGTTSLYDVLCASPEVVAARKKEVRFFDQHWSRGSYWYRWSFPTHWAMAGRGARLTGEASPDYLLHPLAPARAHRVVPEARLIVLLRHPVDRAYSQYRMNLALATEDRSFDEAVDDELARLASRTAADVDRWDDVRNYHSYVERSRYHPQLLRWLAHYPRSALHVTTLESILHDPRPELDRICRYLGIEPVATTGFAHSNRRDYEGLPSARRDELFDLFADDVARTEELLGFALDYGSTRVPPSPGGRGQD
jgi:hypothetical protein